MGAPNTTPGGWQVDAADNVWSAGLVKICDPVNVSSAACYAQPSLEERIANAHQIAASPDLYDALQRIADNPSDVAMIMDCYGRAALAKARGESHA